MKIPKELQLFIMKENYLLNAAYQLNKTIVKIDKPILEKEVYELNEDDHMATYV